MVECGRADDKPDDKPLELFLDRDPDIFAKLLRLMRHMPGVVGLMPKEPFICASLLAEADFFGIDALLQHVKVKAYYNSRRVGEDVPAMPERVTRNDDEALEDYRQRRIEAFSAYKKECRRIRRAFRKKDEAYAVQRFDAVYGSVSNALENDVLPKYFLEAKPLAPPPVKKIVQLLPVEATSWFLVGDIFDSAYGAPEGMPNVLVEDGDHYMMRMADAFKCPGSVRRIACHALTENNRGDRIMEPMLYLSADDYEAWFQSSDVGAVETDEPLVYGTTLEDGQLMQKLTGGLAHRTMLASDWLEKALLERQGHFGIILPEHYWTHILVADTPPYAAGFSRMAPNGLTPSDVEFHVSSDNSDGE